MVFNSKIRAVFFQLNKIFLQFDSFHIFNALTFILQDTLIVLLFKSLSNFSYNFYFEVTLFVVKTIIAVNKLSQAVMFLRIQLFRIIHVNTVIHAHKIGSYCYPHNYCFVCTLPVISFFFLIWLIPYFRCTHIHTSRHTYSIFIFNFITLLQKNLLWSHNFHYWNNCRCKNGK